MAGEVVSSESAGDQDSSGASLLPSNIVRPTYNLTKPGDLICVIFECPVPMMLRPIGEEFRLFGPVYVLGIMRGEAMQEIQKENLNLQVVVLQ